LSKIVAIALFGGHLALPFAAYAAESEEGAVLDEIQVVGKLSETSKSQRSISRVVKNAEQLKKEQVNDIRDLTRYDPGIAVNEQGSGASAGYSIRGVDKDRVAITVDGISQAQNFMPRSSYSEGFSGAKNEIEFENIKAVEISQGANSVMGGNGALGGSVMFVTKEPDDVIKPGQNWGLNIKNSYASKDERWGNSIAAAGRAGGFSALLQYTRRDGHEIKSHPKTPNQTLNRMFPTDKQYEDLRNAGWTDATRPDHFPQGEYCIGRAHPSACVQSMDLAPNEVYGTTRNAANPMDYRSDSWFGKFQYDLTPEHTVGFVFEDTQQKYEIDDRANRQRPYFRNFRDADPSATRHSYIHRMLFPFYKFVDHIHEKNRVGVFYQYQSENRNSWLDTAKLEIDEEKTHITSIHTTAGCTLIGDKPNRDCELFQRQDNIGSSFVEYQHRRQNIARLTEQNKRVRFSGSKSLEYWGIKHEVDLLAGLGHSEYRLLDRYKRREYALKVPDDHPCHDDKRFGCNPAFEGKTQIVDTLHDDIYHPINGKNYYIGLSNHWKLNQYIDLNGGIRYDEYKYHSSWPYFANDKYSSLSWSAGVGLNLTDNISLSYKASTGFRVPNAQEMYGTNGQRHFEKKYSRPLSREKIQAEKAFNQEVGVDIHGNVGYINVNIFRSEYTNFITLKAKTAANFNEPREIGLQYYGNQTKAYAEGFNIRGVVDFHALWNVLPEGLSGSAAYSKVYPKKLGKLSGDSSNMLETSYAMDTLQPAKTVLGLDYDAPSGKWGSGIRFTRSDGKKASELVSKLPNIDIRQSRDISVVNVLSKSWYTWDWVGYVELGKNVTLRGGIYNLTNSKYVTWESLRQTGIAGLTTGVVAEVDGVGYDRLTAPGRNYALSVEFAF
ncbi:lactoferrin/transferrin family TonB-dependent receptor, partial [Pasteurellaceae bacterium USgator11]